MKQKLTHFIVNTTAVAAMVAPMFVSANQILLNIQTFGFVVQYIYAAIMVLMIFARPKINLEEKHVNETKSKVSYLCAIVSAIGAIIVGHPILAIVQIVFIAFLKSLKPN